MGFILKTNEATSPRPHFHAFSALGSNQLESIRALANTLFSFTEDFSTITVFSTYILKSDFNQFTSLFRIVSYLVLNWSGEETANL